MILPLTNKEIKPVNRQKSIFCWCCTHYSAAICASLYAIISTLLLPLTIRGRIGGQYGVLMTVETEIGPQEITLANLPFEFEMFVISLLCIGHLIGLYSVIKKSITGLNCYFVLRIFEMVICIYWLVKVWHGKIKSHTMSQASLGCYCGMSMVTQYVFLLVLLMFSDELSFKVA